jgi:hypothetical protein
LTNYLYQVQNSVFIINMDILMQGNERPLSIADMEALTAQMDAGTLSRDTESLQALRLRIFDSHRFQERGQSVLASADTWLDPNNPRKVFMAAVVFAILASLTEGAYRKFNQGLTVFAIAALAVIYFLKYTMTLYDAIVADDLKDHAAELTAFEGRWAAYTSTSPFAAAALSASDSGPAAASAARG